MTTTNRLAAIAKARREAKTSFTGKGFLDMELLEGKYKMTGFKAVEGWNHFQIIPPKDPEAFFARAVWLHYNIGVNNSTFLCPNKMEHGDKRCPICEYMAKRLKAGADRDDVQAFNPGKRFLYFIVDVSSDEEFEKSPKYYTMPKGNHIDILELALDEDTGEDIDISDPEAGIEIKFKRFGTGKNSTKYKRFSLRDGDPLDPSFLNDIPEFEEALVYYSYDEIKDEFIVALDDDEDDTSGERSYGRRRRSKRGESDDDGDDKKSTRSRGRDRDDDDDDKDKDKGSRRSSRRDDDDQSDTETEKPKGEGRRRSRKSEEEKPDEAGSSDLRTRLTNRLGGKANDDD